MFEKDFIGYVDMELFLNEEYVGLYKNVEWNRGETYSRLLKKVMKQLLEVGKYSDWHCKEYKIEKDTKVKLVFNNKVLKNY